MEKMKHEGRAGECVRVESYIDLQLINHQSKIYIAMTGQSCSQMLNGFILSLNQPLSTHKASFLCPFDHSSVYQPPPKQSSPGFL